MKKNYKTQLLTLTFSLLFVMMMAVPATNVIAAQAPVGLGSTSNFAVLAGETITNTGTTVINGDAGSDVGIYPGSAFTGSASVTMTAGTAYLSDAGGVASTAQTDLVTAYNDAAGRTPVTIIPTELGETTLTPGIYASDSGTFEINGTLTLDAQGDPNGVFVFQMSSSLVTGTSSNVGLLNSARYCRIFWQVGSSATLGVSSHFVGHIFAYTSIWVGTYATVQGLLLARTGEVTLDNNTITNGLCATVTASDTTGTTDTAKTSTSNNPDTGENIPAIGIPIATLLTAGYLLIYANRKRNRL